MPHNVFSYRIKLSFAKLAIFAGKSKHTRMELFYSAQIDGNVCRLDAEESAHCVRVLRHRAGDPVDIIDGTGNLLHCRLSEADPRGAAAEILETVPDWNARPYRLTLGVCPTKNNDRFEWFVEKATEIGVDTIVPLVGEHSERKVYKPERARKIALSATKQSLKARIPVVAEPLTVKQFLDTSGPAGDTLRLIAIALKILPSPAFPSRRRSKDTPARTLPSLSDRKAIFQPERRTPPSKKATSPSIWALPASARKPPPSPPPPPSISGISENSQVSLIFGKASNKILFK